MACWSSGMIRASGARGPGFDSRTGPVFKFSQNASFWSTFEIRKGVRSRGWFRSTDLWVMGPARFLCATLLKAKRFCVPTSCNPIDQKKRSRVDQISLRGSGQALPPKYRAFVAQWLEHWSCKPGVESSNLSEGFCPKWGLSPQYHHNIPAVSMETPMSPQARLLAPVERWVSEKASPNVGLEPTTLRLRV